MSRRITKSDYLYAKGLWALFQSHKSKLDDIERTLAETLSVKQDGSNYWGHLSDGLWGRDESLEDFLARLDYEVGDTEEIEDE